jgi:ankyrin repeat protein
MRPSTKRDGSLPPPLSSHMIKHHLKFRGISTTNEGGEKDRELRLQGALEYEIGDTVRGITEAAKHNDFQTLTKALPYLRHVTQDHYMELLNAPLNAAAHANNSECVTELIKWGANTNRLFNGQPSSVVAASQGNLESLHIIMENGCDLNAQSESGFTPLMIACENGHYEVAVTLINAGADRNLTSTAKGLTALMIAAKRGNINLCRALLEPNTSTGEPGCEREIKELKLGYTAFIFAARRDFVAVVELLINEGINIQSRDNNGMTAIHHAAYFNRLKTFRYLWTFSGCINSKDDQGRTPLMIAVQRGHRAIVELCVDFKPKEQLVDKDAHTIGDYNYGLENKLEDDDDEEDEDYLRQQRTLAEKIDIESQDVEGKTALMYAVLHSCHVLIPLLMVYGGAPLNQEDHDKNTAYSLAEDLKMPKMCKLLQNCAKSREHRVLQMEARRLRAEKEARKAARRAEMSDSEFDFTSSDDEEDGND